MNARKKSTTLCAAAVTALGIASMSACAKHNADTATPTETATDESPGESNTSDVQTRQDDWSNPYATGTLDVEQPVEHSKADASMQDDDEPPVTQVVYVVESTLMDACGLVPKAVYFDTDSTEVSERGEMQIDRLAACLQSPVMTHEYIEVIGHADERGPKPYNKKLGLGRAEAVAEALTDAGVGRARIMTRSFGERRADDPEYWNDRKVYIRLLE